jgi:hypothetical protein
MAFEVILIPEPVLSTPWFAAFLKGHHDRFLLADLMWRLFSFRQP